MACSSYKDAAVYGVKVPNTEGRAGMVAIADPDKRLDLEKIAVAIQTSLPAYARPLFLRALDEVDTTGENLFCYIWYYNTVTGRVY